MSFKTQLIQIAGKEGFKSWQDFLCHFLIKYSVPSFNLYMQDQYRMFYSNETYYHHYNIAKKETGLKKNNGIKYSKIHTKWDKIASENGYKDLEDLFFRYPGTIYKMSQDLEINMNTLYKRRSELKIYRFYKKTLDMWLHIV